ncbi:MAG: NAD-dependent epimerase/dehydratase family protein [Granulosicoccus sp.]
MHVLVLGGTGSIGAAIVDELIKRQCEVSALSRSPISTEQLLAVGATPIQGDIRYPEKWIDCLECVDAVIHAAATWDDDMDTVDQNLVAALLKGLRTPDSSKTLIYTAGCWLYGQTGDVIATERTSLSPAPGFLRSISTLNQVLADTHVKGMVIHPAMVYEHRGGVFQRMYDDIENHGHIRVYGSLDVRWPLIHTLDLAQVYALMLLKGKAGDVYNASSMDGVRVGDIANAISSSAGNGCKCIVYDVKHAKRDFGDWAEGYAIDQNMSAEKARVELGWQPAHSDVFEDIC